MRKTFLSASLLFSTLTYAQDKEFLPEGKLKYSWGGKFHLIDDSGLKVKHNLNKQQMLNLLSEYNAGKDLYQSFRKTNTLSKVFVWSGVGTAVAGLGCMFAGIDFDNTEITNETLFWTGMGLEGVTIILEGLGLGFGISAKVKGYQLSSGYNKHQEKYSFNFGATKHGVGLTLKF